MISSSGTLPERSERGETLEAASKAARRAVVIFPEVSGHCLTWVQYIDDDLSARRRTTGHFFDLETCTRVAWQQPPRSSRRTFSHSSEYIAPLHDYHLTPEPQIRPPNPDLSLRDPLRPLPILQPPPAHLLPHNITSSSQPLRPTTPSLRVPLDILLSKIDPAGSSSRSARGRRSTATHSTKLGSQGCVPQVPIFQTVVQPCSAS
jgi:hypothetical protein